MVDGADKINSVSNNVHINQQDAIRITVNENKEPIPLVEKNADYEFPFTIQPDKDALKFKLPEDAPENAKLFATALIKNKKVLMEDLNIDSETYNMFAQIAVGLAKKETDFNGTGNRIYKAFRELYVRYERMVGTSLRKPMHYSRGMTNIKYTLHTAAKDEETQVKTKMLKYGISDEYELENIEKSAICTIILLDYFNRKLDDSLADGFKQSQGKYGATRMNALCRLWNGDPNREILNGKFDPNNPFWTYAKDIERFCEEYKIVNE